MQELHIDDQVEGPIEPRVINTVSPNMLRTRVSEVCEEMGEPNWSKLIIADERNFVTLIANKPGTGNRPHWHREFDEYWVVMEGTLQWELDPRDHHRGGEGRYRVCAARLCPPYPEHRRWAFAEARNCVATSRTCVDRLC